MARIFPFANGVLLKLTTYLNFMENFIASNLHVDLHSDNFYTWVSIVHVCIHVFFNGQTCQKNLMMTMMMMMMMMMVMMIIINFIQLSCNLSMLLLIGNTIT